jgi:hypothetical protein
METIPLFNPDKFGISMAGISLKEDSGEQLLMRDLTFSSPYYKFGFSYSPFLHRGNTKPGTVGRVWVETPCPAFHCLYFHIYNKFRKTSGIFFIVSENHLSPKKTCASPQVKKVRTGSRCSGTRYGLIERKKRVAVH